MLGGSIGIGELILVFLILLLAFGPDKVPEICRALGRGLKEFRKTMRKFELEDDDEEKKE